MIFISVNTPTKSQGIGAGQASNLKWIEASARQISKHAKGKTIVVEKSTLPVKTAQVIKQILEESSTDYNSNSSSSKSFSVLSNPEFLAEGTAINDLENPDRVLIGGEESGGIGFGFHLPENISIKATTTDYLGFIGEKKGIAAITTCLLILD